MRARPGLLPGNVRFGRSRDRKNLLGHLGRECDHVRAACCDGVLGHRVELRRLRLLHHDKAALGLDGLQADRAVRSHAGKHDADGSLAELAGERTEQNIDRQPHAARSRRFVQVQCAARHGQFGIRRDHIHRVGFDGLHLRDLVNGHGGRALQKLPQQRLVRRVHVLHDDIGEAARGRDMTEELLQRLESARGGAEADDADSRRSGGCLRIRRSGHA